MDDATLLARYAAFAVDQENAPQWRGFAEHRLVVARCHECGHWMNPPIPMCPKCWSEEVSFEEVSGRGKVKWFSLLYPRGAQPDETPYPAAVVELEEQAGLRMIATVVDCDPSEIRCDGEVDVTWINVEGAEVPAFRLRTHQVPIRSG